MELNRGQWFVRWFFWSLEILEEFTESYQVSRYEDGTNLCHFMRVTLVWTPLVILLNLAVYGTAVLAVTALPIYLYGAAGYGLTIGSVVLVVGLILLAKQGARWIKQRELRNLSDEERLIRKLHPHPARTEAVETPQSPGFFAVLWESVVAAKKKICPTITFDNELHGGVQ